MENKDIIYDHYKETCEICRNKEKDRNKLFIMVGILLTLLFLFMIAEDNTIKIFYEVLQEKYDLDVTLSVETIQSLIWGLLLYFTIRYYQQCISIERMYQYIHQIEERMSNELEFEIIREGKNYLQEYPWILNYIWIIYTVVFPIVYLVLIVINLIVDVHTKIFDWNLTIHFVFGICDIILVISYLFFLHRISIKKIFNKDEK